MSSTGQSIALYAVAAAFVIGIIVSFASMIDALRSRASTGLPSAVAGDEDLRPHPNLRHRPVMPPGWSETQTDRTHETDAGS